MKRLLLDATWISCAVALLIGCYLWSVRVSVVEAHLSALIDTPVSVDSVSFGVGQVVISDININIDNRRQETALSRAFHADRVRIVFDLGQLLADKPLVDEVIIERAFLGIVMFESGGSDNNWQEILNGLPAQHRRWQYRIKQVTLKQVEIRACNDYLCQKIVRASPVEHILVSHPNPDQSMEGREAITLIARAIMREGQSLPGFGNILDDIEEERQRKPLFDYRPYDDSSNNFSKKIK